MEPRKHEHKPHPQPKANCLSKLFFSWTGGLSVLASKRPLGETDLYDVLPEDSSIQLSNTLAREWEQELYHWKTGGSHSLTRALLRCYVSSLVGLSLLFVFVEACRVSQALFLGWLLSYFEADSTVDWFMAYMYAVGWSLSYICATVLDNVGLHRSLYLGLRIRVTLTSIIYRKILRLSQYSVHEGSRSNIVRLLSTDANKLDQLCQSLCYVWLCPLQALSVLLCVWLVVGLGPFCLVMLLLLCLLTPLQYWLAKYLQNLRQKVCELTERRLRLMSDLLGGMKVIKMNCWEKPFSALIRTARGAESTYLRTITHCLGVHTSLSFVTGKLLVFGTITLYFMMGYHTSPSVLFTVMFFCEILRSNVCVQFPWAIRNIHECRTALGNIQSFLLLDERNTVETPAQLSLLKRSPLPDNILLRLEDYTASWHKDKNKPVTLDGLNFSVQKGQLVVITGLTGSGKTSILNSVLGEIPRLGGFVRSRGRVGFVPQSNWVLSATFRENVMFGLEMDRRKYNKVLYACGLVKDLDSLPYNDLTPLGERGVTLTLAQKAKVGLARAVYQGADVYMVDDVFSCIDDKDSSHIFTKCFCGLISTKTIVLVTHKLKFLKAADSIICLKQGKVHHQGTYSNLKKQGIDFKQFLPDLEQDDLPSAANQNEPNIPAGDSPVETSMRQKLWLDHFYSADEALDKVWLQFEDSSDSDLLAPEDDLEPTPGASWSTYWNYFRLGGGVIGIVSLIVFSLFTQVSYFLCDWFLYDWSRSHRSSLFPSDLDPNTTSVSPTNPPLFTFIPTPPHSSFYPYLGLFLGFVFCVFSRGFVFSGAVARFSRRIHEHILRSVLRANSGFFEKNTLGSILCRFGRDLSYADDSLPASLFDVVQFYLLALGTLVVMAAANYWLLIAILPVCALFGYGRYKFVSTARELRRLESNTKGAVYQHLSNTIEGMWTVRAFSMEDKFLRYFDIYMDRHTAAAYLYLAVNRWFALRMDLLSVILVALLAFVSVAVQTYTAIHPGLLGLAMVYTVQMLGLAQCAVRQAVEVDHQLCGVERLLKYRSLPQEGALMTAMRPSPPWPQYGIVTLEGVSVQAGAAAEETGRTLRNIWCCFRSEEKVGIISRPEGCKRALVSSILRLCDSSGSIRIDGLDVSEIGLQDLRNKVSVIPMDPSLFSGSMRRNLDPYSRHPDAHLWRALELVQLKEKVEALPGKMYAEMCDYGNNFSLGERQLVCVARAILRPSKVLIFEESSSLISPRCERLIHHLLHTKFQNSTVLIVAHRLHSIIDTDRVMVLLDGRVQEFDPPHTLLQNPQTQLSRMVAAMGQHRAKLFRDIAKDRHDNKPYTAPPQSPTVAGSDGLMPYAGHRQSNRAFLPSFHNNRLSGVLSQFGGGGKFSASKF